MGVTLVATCRCGYASPELRVGCGAGHVHELVSCADCRRLEAAPMVPRHLVRCPRCAGPAAPLEPDDAADFDWGLHLWPCPRCAATTLRLAVVGCWT